MGIAVKCARVGNKILSFIAMVLVLIMLLYGGYSLWNTIMIYRGAFSSNDLLKYQPTGDGPNSITLGELMKLNKDVDGLKFLIPILVILLFREKIIRNI